MITLYRVQHRVDGRGPFRKDFSRVWIDPDPNMKDIAKLPPLDEDPGLPPVDWIVQRFHAAVRAGYHCGCGCRTLNKIREWFTRTELKTLGKLGYHTVATRAIVVAESDHQIAFVRPWPLAMRIRVVDPYPGGHHRPR